MSLFGSTTAFSDKEKNTKIDHVLIGIVTANADDKGHTYRVKVRIPSLEGGGEGDKVQDSTHWCRIASFMAGEHVGDDASNGPRGAYFMPEIGDEVLVAFEHGDISRPIVIGRMWSDVAPDKTAKGGDDGAPNRPVYAHTSQKGVLADSPDEKDVKGPSLKTKHETKIPKAKLGLAGFDYLGGKSMAKLLDCERRATEAALTTAGRPNCTFTIDRIDEEHLGAFFQMMEFETAFLGELLDINAFDQEGVELGKKFTYALMGRAGFDEFKQAFADYEKKRG